MGKITMQDIADSLEISRITVWKALNNQKGVSDNLKQIIFDKAKELGYLKNENSTPIRNVALIVSRPESSIFWTTIIHRIAQELIPYNINLIYVYMPTIYAKDFTMPLVLTNDSLNGAIILNICDGTLIKLINALPIPKVFLDTVPQVNDKLLNGDLILLEGFSTCYDITNSVLKKGITQIGFIGDIYYAKTNMDRYLGYCQCIKDYNLTVDSKFLFTQSIDIFAYHDTLFSYLDSLQTLPQAFVCASDYIAHFLKEYFSENSQRIPNGIIITGYDGSKEYSDVWGNITTANVDTSLLGKRLSLQIIYRMDHQNAPYELTFVKPEIVYKDSIFFN